MTRLLAFIALAFIITNGTIWAQSYQGRLELHNSQVKGCERGRADRIDENGTDRDLAAFARDAAAKRLAEGAPALARKYAARAANADARVIQRTKRIVDCSDAFPAPSLWPHF